MKSQVNISLMVHLLITEQLRFEDKANEELNRPDGTADQSREDKAWNIATFRGRADAYKDAAFRVKELRVMIS